MVASCNNSAPVAPRRFPGGTPADGFTLIELVVVLAILALATGAALITTRDANGTTRLAPFAAQIATELKSARTRAVLSSRPVAFELNARQRTYRIGASQPVVLPDAVAISVRSAHAASGRLEFYPDGSSSGGAIRIAIGSAAMVLDVAWLTGAVEIRSGL